MGRKMRMMARKMRMKVVRTTLGAKFRAEVKAMSDAKSDELASHPSLSHWVQ